MQHYYHSIITQRGYCQLDDVVTNTAGMLIGWIILLVVERENEVYSHECPFNTIFITGMSNTDILGRYCAEDVIGDDCLLHYRKYVKDKTATSGLCILYMQHEENTVFYHANPYFDVETILKSDDDDFKNRVSLPF